MRADFLFPPAVVLLAIFSPAGNFKEQKIPAQQTLGMLSFTG
jgi:hypothetical protein